MPATYCEITGPTCDSVRVESLQDAYAIGWTNADYLTHTGTSDRATIKSASSTVKPSQILDITFTAPSTLIDSNTTIIQSGIKINGYQVPSNPLDNTPLVFVSTSNVTFALGGDLVTADNTVPTPAGNAADVVLASDDYPLLVMNPDGNPLTTDDYNLGNFAELRFAANWLSNAAWLYCNNIRPWVKYRHKRFVPVITYVDGEPLLTITDIDNSDRIVVQTQANAKLHIPLGFGSLDHAHLDVDYDAQPFERVVPVPGGGVMMESGVDLTFTLTNTSSTETQEVGTFGFSCARLGYDAEAAGYGVSTLSQSVWQVFEAITGTGSAPANPTYPTNAYFPGLIAKGPLYAMAAYLLYQPVEWDHPVVMFNFTNDDTDPPHQFQAVWQCGVEGTESLGMLAPSETREYSLCLRFKDAGDVDEGNPLSWLPMLASYRDHFRALYGKPDYRSMGGWDGRPVRAYNVSTITNGTPGRGWLHGEDPSNSLGAGYGPMTTDILDAQTNYNISRCMIWGLPGCHDTSIECGTANYAFRFATGVSELGPPASTTIGDATTDIPNAGIQLGMWWGNSLQPEKSSTWDTSPCGNEPLDPRVTATPGTTAYRAHVEGDLAINTWGAQCIGLDAFNTSSSPAQMYDWLQHLKDRYPGTLFVTEPSAPDFLHTLAPTFISSLSQDTEYTPFWLHHFINPGSETWLLLYHSYVSIGNPTFIEYTDGLAAKGYTVVTEDIFEGSYGQGAVSSELRAGDRWTELGETAIDGYDGPLEE